MTEKTASPGAKFLRLLPAAFLFAALGMIVTLLVAFGLAVLISNGILPASAQNMTALCCVPGCVVTGYCTAHRAGRNIIPMGLLAAVCFLVTLLLIGAAFLPGLSCGDSLPGIIAADVGGCTAGALGCLGMKKR